MKLLLEVFFLLLTIALGFAALGMLATTIFFYFNYSWTDFVLMSAVTAFVFILCLTSKFVLKYIKNRDEAKEP